ncbi:MAG: hypothetical protein M3Y07_05095 [Acidobacteriota bacterium]|nr:hypothetical protein [Acidobacteriota bacterium]
MRYFAAVIFAVTLALAPLRAAEPQQKPEKDMMAWLWANFLILAGGIGYLAVKKGGPYFILRSEDIRRGIAESEKLKSEADARVAAVSAKLATLDAEIASMRSAIREEQAQENERIQRETASELARIQQRGEQEIEAAGKLARLELRRHAAQLSLELAERKLRHRMNPEMQRSLTRSFVQDLRENAGEATQSSR